MLIDCISHYHYQLISYFLDAYIEVDESLCLRSLQLHPLGIVRPFNKQNAKYECSVNRRCTGIKPYGWDNDIKIMRFQLCLDSIYTSAAWDKNDKEVDKVFKKATSYGMCTSLKLA